MKKFLLFVAGILLSVTMVAQEKVAWQDFYSSVVFKGGYNVLEKRPVATVDFYADIGLFRAEIELGYAFGSEDEALPMPIYFSPALGVSYGCYSIFYFLVGAQPFITKTIREQGARFSLEAWHLKLEGGVDIRLSDLFFLDLSAVYLVPRKDTETTQHFQNLSFMIGLGINF